MKEKFKNLVDECDKSIYFHSNNLSKLRNTISNLEKGNKVLIASGIKKQIQL